MRKVLVRMQQRVKASSFDAWVDVYEEQKRRKLDENATLGETPNLSPQERQCKRVLTRMLNTLLGRAMDRWKEQTAEHKR